MVQAFPITSFLNTDDPDEVINPAHNSHARNVQFKGTLPNMRAENIPGTREKNNPYLINDGNNLTIGKHYDPIGKRIFFFNYRGDNSKGIYMYDTINGIFYRLVVQGYNAENDVLGFTDIGIISNIDIIYGDSTQGDILFFVDSNGVPKKVNIQRALNGGYGTIKKSYLDVAKEPADIPPYVAYENDAANTVNNLRKKLFKFKVRWVFDDQDKSVTSSQSVLPLPLAPFDQSVDSDPTKNCRIAITYQTGPPNVKKIEVIGAVSLGNAFSDFFLIASIDKSVSGLGDDDVATFLFYNNEAYNYIDVQESIQLFDYVPITAGTQTLLNGNVLSYGNITEGYPNHTNFNASAINTSNVPYYSGSTWSYLVGNQSGNSGFGSGNIHIVVRGIILSPSGSLDTYTIYMTDGSNVSYTLNIGDDASAIIQGLRADAISKGYTIVSSGSNDLIITKTGISLARVYITSNYSYNALINNSYFAYDWYSKYAFGLVYFDAKERTNGVVYTSGFSVSSNAFTEVDASTPNKSKFTASIYHQPPTWADSFQWVRTKNLSKSKFQQWITDRTFKDTIAVSGIIKYAYLSIESLNEFVENNPGSPLGYAFASGDRIRFFKRYNSDNTTANLYGNTKDFEIVASLTNPTINGEVKSGQFVKILLPTTDGTFDFGVSGYENYLVELYTPAQSVANNLNVYYEFGKRYAIGDPTLSSRFHQGETANQVVNVSPAIYDFTEGDNYIRLRSIQAGNVYTFNITTGSASGAGGVKNCLIGMNFAGSTYSDSNIVAQSVPFANIASFDPGTDTRWFLKSVSQPATFKFSGTIILNFPTARPAGDSWHVYIQNKYGDVQEIVAPFDNTNGGTFTFPISGNVTIENDNIFLGAASIPGYTRDINVLVSSLTFTIDHVISQRCIDANFSDYFPSAVNSNGRAFVYNENANQVTFPTMYRWSLAYQEDTGINQSNRFYPQNFDNVDRRFGAIKRMRTWDRLLTFFQERKCGQTGIYQKFITDSAGSQQLVTTTSIITDNNVQYYNGDFGVGNQGDSVVQSGFVYYFVDPIKSKILRLSRDGLTDLTELYKTQTWAAQNIPSYLINKNYTFGGYSRITGTFNVRKDNTGEYLCVLQPWYYGSETFAGETIAFDETRNCFTSWYDYSPEQILCAENVLYSWRNGKMYIHDVTTNNGMNKFYGMYYDPTITKVFNAGLIEKKSFISITEVASTIWDCPQITTNNMSYGSTPQQSNLITQDFVNEESNFSASFLNDSNSVGGISDGDSLKGNLIKIKFRAPNATSLVTLSAVNLAFIDSPFTNR